MQNCLLMKQNLSFRQTFYYDACIGSLIQFPSYFCKYFDKMVAMAKQFMPGSFRLQTTDHHKPDVLWTSICMHRHKIQIKIKLRPVMFDISQYNDGCSPALTFKTSNRGLGPRTVACSILVSYNQLLDMIHARVDCDCNGQRTVINDGN